MKGAAIVAALLLLAVIEEAFRLNYKNKFGKMGPREAALAEASHGAALIVLPPLALLRFGGISPACLPWLLLAMLALMGFGGFWLHSGAKFAAGWRDPKLIARASIKIGFALLPFEAMGAAQFGNADPLLDPVVNAVFWLVGWWLLVTGAAKLFLVLRGLPAAPWAGQPQPMTHGTATFGNPNNAAKDLSK